MTIAECSGKVGYDSPHEAHQQLKKRQRKPKRNADRRGYTKAHVYKCPACGRYHIGHRDSW